MPQRGTSSSKGSSQAIVPVTAVVLWAALCLAAAFYGNWEGYGGRQFAATLAAFAILLGGELCVAAPTLIEGVQRVLSRVGPQGSALAALWPLGAYVLYAVGTGTAQWKHFGVAIAYTLVPFALEASAHSSKPGAWQDYASMFVIFFPFKMNMLNGLFPYPGPLGYVLTMLLAINVALASFLFVRKLDGVGYSIGWGWHCLATIAISFGIIAAIDIPLALRIHFVRFDPHAAYWRGFPVSLLEIFIFIAWPEEFLFRGLLQNILGKSLGSETVGWITASIIFGLSHIHNGVFPNWRYVILATIAGFFYGYAWRRGRSMFPSAIVHTLVDGVWRLLFPTV